MNPAFIMILFLLSPAWATSVTSSSPTPIAVSTPTPVQQWTPASVTVVHPLEGAKLPPLKEVFVFGAVMPGSTLMINGSTVTVHPKGGYLTMVPLVPGEILLALDTKAPGGQTAHLDRRFSVNPGFVMSPLSPITLVKESITPAEDLFLSAGDTVRVAFQGSPQGTAEFSIDGVARHVPMLEMGNPPHGIYEGSYLIKPGLQATQAGISVTLKKREWRKEGARQKP